MKTYTGKVKENIYGKSGLFVGNEHINSIVRPFFGKTVKIIIEEIAPEPEPDSGRLAMTFREFINRFGSDKLDIARINPYAINEGLADYSDKIYLNKNQADELGVDEEEWQDRVQKP